MPDCINAAVSGGCPAMPGLTWTTSNQGAFTAVDCNVFNNQNVQPGSQVAQGTLVTAYYNPAPRRWG